MEYLLAFAIFLPIVAGLLLGWHKTNNPWAAAMATTVITALLTSAILVTGVGALSLPLLHGDGIGLDATTFARLYGIITTLLWLVGVALSKDYFPNNAPHLRRYYASLLVTLGGTLGVFFAADLLTLFIFFEVMSFTSYLWVVQAQDESSNTAGESYLAFSVFGGLSILFGLFLLYGLCPNLQLDSLTDHFAPLVGNTQHTAACLFLLLGFGIKAGVFFLYDWLPLAYTAAPAPASGLFSGLLSKTGLYGILLIVWRISSTSQEIAFFVLFLALLNMLVGGLFALFSNNLKSTLAYSSISQIGFILWGIAMTALLGEHGAVAAYGTLFHMVNHSLIKVLLFSLAGVIYCCAGTLNLNQIQGIGQGHLWLQLAFLSGAAGAAGIPGLSGYISKALLHESVTEYIHLTNATSLFTLLEYLFLLAGGCTLAYMGKLYLCLFHQGKENNSLHLSSGVTCPLLLIGFLLLLLGTVPHYTLDWLGHYTADFMGVTQMETVSYFSWANLSGSLLSILLGLCLLIGERIWRKKHGQDSSPFIPHGQDTLEYIFYRPLLQKLSFFCALVARIFDVLLDCLACILCHTFFSPLTIPESFYYGDSHDIKAKRTKIHITFSLAYSLLMFGMGFLFTIICLLVLGGRGA